MATPEELLEEASTYDSLGNLAKTGVGAWLLAVVTAAITTSQELLDLLVVTPIDVLTEVMRKAAEAFLIAPLGLPISGADASAEGVQTFGFLALPVAVAVALATIYLVQLYRRQPSTSDVPIPGVGVDVIPFVGQEDEEEEA